jgi:hypothetical protein
MACPVSAQERLRGWRCRGRPFGGRPRADLRVPLTGGRMGHNSGRDDVLSPRVSTASGWCYSARDGVAMAGMAAHDRWRQR